MKFERNPLVNKPATGKHILCNKAAAAPMAMSRLISISTEPILMRFLACQGCVFERGSGFTVFFLPTYLAISRKVLDRF